MSVLPSKDPAGKELVKWGPDAQYALSRHGEIDKGWVVCFCMETGDYYPCKSINSNLANVTAILTMKKLAGKENIGIKAVSCEENKPVYIVMERCMGQCLEERIRNRKYPETDAAKLTKIIVGVIKICHEAKVTLGNGLEKTFIFLNKNNDCALKAVDFEGASILNNLTEGEKKMMERDIQSAGKILYALVTGERLSEDDQKGIIKGKGPKSSEETLRKWHLVSEGAKSLIQKMLGKNPLTATDVLSDEWICTNGRELVEAEKHCLKAVTQNLNAIKIGEKRNEPNRRN